MIQQNPNDLDIASVIAAIEAIHDYFTNVGQPENAKLLEPALQRMRPRRTVDKKSGGPGLELVSEERSEEEKYKMMIGQAESLAEAGHILLNKHALEHTDSSGLRDKFDTLIGFLSEHASDTNKVKRLIARAAAPQKLREQPTPQVQATERRPHTRAISGADAYERWEANREKEISETSNDPAEATHQETTTAQIEASKEPIRLRQKTLFPELETQDKQR